MHSSQKTYQTFIQYTQMYFVLEQEHFLAMSDYQGFLGEVQVECKNLQTHVIMFPISEAFRETRGDLE